MKNIEISLSKARIFVLIPWKKYFFFQILVRAHFKKALFWITSKVSKGCNAWEQKCSSRSVPSCASYKTILYITCIQIEHDVHGNFCSDICVLQRFYPAARYFPCGLLPYHRQGTQGIALVVKQSWQTSLQEGLTIKLFFNIPNTF